MRKVWDALCDTVPLIIGSLTVGVIVLFIWGFYTSFATGWFTATTMLGALRAGGFVATGLFAVGFLGKPIAEFLELLGSMAFVIVFGLLYEDEPPALLQ